jgi:ssDNA thymidine ADP-ribosyltransferase DarT-like protein
VPIGETAEVPQPPNPVLVFHITAIDNLAAIGASGALLAKSRLISGRVLHASIAYEHIQDRRSQKIVPIGPGGSLHDYVPFHFAPRSPMLLAIHGGNVPNCLHRQQDIVHLVGRAEDVVAAGLPFVFSNYHAVLDFAEFFAELASLDRIDWPLFFESPKLGGYCQYWQSRPEPRYMLRKETRQAEFLIHQSVPISLIRGVVVYNAAAEARVRTVLQQVQWEVPVKVVPAWYY